MAANSNAPSRAAFDLYLDGADWKLSLFTTGGVQVAAAAPAKVGSVNVATGGIVTLPLNFRALCGEPAHEMRFFGAGNVTVVHANPVTRDYPYAVLNVKNGEILAQQFETLVAVDPGITRIAISFGDRS